MLDDLEVFRSKLGRVYDSTPGEVTVVIHPRPFALALAHPWLPVARRLSAPAARRYYAGWFSEGEIHVLAPDGRCGRGPRAARGRPRRCCSRRATSTPTW